MGQSRKCLVTDDYVETPVRRLWTILRYPRDCPSAVEQLCLLGRVLKFDSRGVMAETNLYHGLGFHALALRVIAHSYFPGYLQNLIILKLINSINK